MFNKTLWQQIKTNKHERRGIIIFLIFIIILTIGLKYFTQRQPDIINTDEASINVLNEYYSSLEEKEKSKKVIYKKDFSRTTPSTKSNKLTKVLRSKIVLQYFDPNIADHASLLSLGFSDRQAHTIIKFRSKGFGFKKPEDLFKIYNIDTSHVRKLIPYMLFPKNKDPDYSKDLYTQNTNSIHTDSVGENQKSYSVLKKVRKEKIEINTATQESLKSIYGIGNIFSEIIINYRDKLGGYIHKSQLAEPYSFADSTLTFLEEGITIDTSIRRKINLNTATLADLYEHPYLTFDNAKVLYPFVERRRPWKDLKAIDNILALDKETIVKISPYLTINDVPMKDSSSEQVTTVKRSADQ